MNRAPRLFAVPAAGAAVALLAALLATAGCSKSPSATAAGSPDAPAAPSAGIEGLPEPGPARPLAVPAARDFTLANGLRVIAVPRRGSPLVTLEFVALTGSEADPEDRAGLADFTATLLTQGTRSRSAPQIAETAESLGGSISAAAQWDASTLAITVTTPKAAAAAALLADVVRNPRFAGDDIERQRAQALDALRVSLSEPRTLATLAAARLAWGAGAYGHPRMGTPASLARIGADDLRRFHASGYRPDRALLVVAGDLDAEAAQALAQTCFGDWPRPVAEPPAAPASGAPVPAAQVLVIDMPEAGQAAVAAVHRMPPRTSEDYYQGQLMNAVLAGGYSSRMNLEIRIRRGLSYGVSGRLSARRAGGDWTAVAQTKNESAVEVLELMQAQIAGMAAAEPPAAELNARRLSTIGQFGRSLETTAGLAEQFAQRAVQGLPLSELAAAVPAIEAVTASQLRDYAASRLDAAGTRYVIAGDARQFLPALKARMPGVVVLPVASLDLEAASLVPAEPATGPAAAPAPPAPTSAPPARP